MPLPVDLKSAKVSAIQHGKTLVPWILLGVWLSLVTAGLFHYVQKNNIKVSMCVTKDKVSITK